MHQDSTVQRKEKWPNFFIIGSTKSGTTSLYSYLNQHPDIFMSSVKEPRYFAFFDETFTFANKTEENWYALLKSDATCETAEYLALFEKAGKAKVLGEASPLYLSLPYVPQKIFNANPKSKLIAILRNPFDAAYSQFLMNKRQNMVSQDYDFLDILKEEDIESQSVLRFPRYIRIRYYDIFLHSYLDIFPRNQLYVLLHEDLSQPEETLKNIFQFLEVDPDVEIDTSTWFNATTNPKSASLIDRVLKKIPFGLRDKLRQTMPPSLFAQYMKFRFPKVSSQKAISSKCPPEAKEYLLPIFEPRIRNLEKIIGRDLSHWLI